MTVIIILGTFFLLLAGIRTGYKLGRKTTEDLVVRYARTHPFRFTFDLVDDLYPDKAEEMIHVRNPEDLKKCRILEEHWGHTGNRRN